MPQKIIGSEQPIPLEERIVLGLGVILHINGTPVMPVGGTAPDWHWQRIMRQHRCTMEIGDGYRILRPEGQPWAYISYPADRAADVPTPLQEIGLYYWGEPITDHIERGLELVRERIWMYL